MGGGGPLWGGRFRHAQDAAFEAINRSLDVDRRLAAEDVECGRAHVAGLREAGVVDDATADALEAALAQVAEEVAAGEFPPDGALDEDVHLAVERRVTEIAGRAGGALHTGRSRNDLVATDLALWLRRRLAALGQLALELADALRARADADQETILPGYTHLQRAQPVLLAHHLAAHAWMAVRAARRFGTVIELHDECPLGAGALAGANYPLDRAAIARRLGFSRATPNSLDAVSSRAFALDALAAMAACATDASRLGAELVLWSSQEFGFVELPDAWTSGSSIMPQKKNPDAAELVRAKAARVAGAWHTLQSVLQALPLAYAKDLQEDKPAVFDAAETTALVLVALSGMVGGMAVRPDRMSDAARGGMMAATDVADALVGLGVPFREAHGRVGRLVRALADSARTLEEARPDEVGSLHPDLTGDRYRALVSVEATVARKGTAGGTGPAQVRDQLAQLAEAIGAARSGLAAYAHA